MSNYEDHPPRLSEEEVFVIFDVVNKRGEPKEAQEIIHKKLHLPRPHRTTIARVFNVSVELFKREPNAPVLTTQEADEIVRKVGYGVGRSRVVELHRLYQLWKSRRQEETKGKRPQGAAEDVKETFKAQLFTPAPEDILIDDLGSLGDHSARLRQDTLNVVIQSLGYTAGVKATVSTATWGALPPREIEVFWRVLPSLLVERYCPVEHEPLFQHWLASAPSTLKQDFVKWKQLGGSCLAQCGETRMKIHASARQETRAWVAENLIAALPRVFSPPPQPLTANFGNLIYQLAIEYCRSEGARGLPDESSYDTMPGDRPPWVKLVLGQTRIPLGNPLPGLIETWIDLHRKMIEEWGQSRGIRMLLDLFQRLQHLQETIMHMLLH
jgi:hypothetical protein